MYLLSQIFGFAAIVVAYFIYQQGKRKNVILLKLIADVLWVLCFVFVGGYTGALTTFVSIFREIVFYNRFKKKWAGSKFWLCLFMGIYIFIGILNIENIFEILPTLASSVSTIGYWNKNVKAFKLISIPVSLCMLIYNIYCMSIAGIWNEVITLSSIIIFSIREKWNKK
ncbi:MAG: YgjV family protein [Ruminococcaceae bacterium]|nr:YgjV family protein [Oscillospiraceae bacterium]